MQASGVKRHRRVFCFLRERDPLPATVHLALRYMRLLIRLKSGEMKVERNRGCEEEERDGGGNGGCFMSLTSYEGD